MEEQTSHMARVCDPITRYATDKTISTDTYDFSNFLTTFFLKEHVFYFTVLRPCGRKCDVRPRFQSPGHPHLENRSLLLILSVNVLRIVIRSYIFCFVFSEAVLSLWKVRFWSTALMLARVL